MSVRFEWNPRKAAVNLRKHGVSFAEASTVFDDPLARMFDDADRSTDNRLVVVCFSERRDDVVRIFSARPATKREREDYEENLYP